jgi:sortase A
VRRLARILGTLLLAGGVLTLAWVICVWQWQDPFTAIYTHFQQERLSQDYTRQAAAFRPSVTKGGNLVSLERQVADEARAYGKTLHTGGAVGRIKIGRIGLDMVVVQGTDESSLQKGPGHYARSGLPGEGHLVYVAGHRTTYLAPFAYINNIKVGDFVTFEVPYGTFTYRVTRHYVVPATDVSVLADHGREILRLQACHPRFFATHRYLVDAKLVSVLPRGGASYTPGSSTELAARRR